MFSGIKKTETEVFEYALKNGHFPKQYLMVEQGLHQRIDSSIDF